MSVLKRFTGIPWRLSSPIRRRIVFRLLHYGRHLLEPVFASTERIERRLERVEDQQRQVETATALRLEALHGQFGALHGQFGALHGELEAAAQGATAMRAQADTLQGVFLREVGFLSANMSGLLRDVDRVLTRIEDLADTGAGGAAREGRPVPGATVDVAQFASSPAAIVSYAQNREDVLLQRLFPLDYRGFYVDVGAGDPVEFSVTKHFYDRGWTGINLEPAIFYHDRLVAQRPRDVNLKVGAWDSDGELELFETMRPSGLSTFLPQIATAGEAGGWAFRKRRVPISTLATVLGSFAPPQIDFLKIDVEGAERRVLSGNDWMRFRPKVVVVEATRPGSTEPSHGEWEELLVGSGYVLAAFDGLNRFYVRGDDAALVELLRIPVNVFDNYLPYEVMASVVDHQERIRAATRDVSGVRQALERLGEGIAFLSKSRSPVDASVPGEDER